MSEDKDPESCKYYSISEIWENREYVSDQAYCKKKNSLMYDPSKEDEYFDHNIKCPCKTLYKPIGNK
ncbi:MAG: hypothetical protein JRJ00_00090 [Deltaproteobacteria bacterium]|nr:hypothetical protein [Deltaproteobacteria bacterium]